MGPGGGDSDGASDDGKADEHEAKNSRPVFESPEAPGQCGGEQSGDQEIYGQNRAEILQRRGAGSAAAHALEQVGGLRGIHEGDDRHDEIKQHAEKTENGENGDADGPRLHCELSL